MALAAEVIQEISVPQPNLRLVVPLESTHEPTFIDADTIPELQWSRQRAARQAADILGENRRQLIDGDFDNPPKPVDALGTARQVRSMGEVYGQDSPEHREGLEGLLLDCDRLLGESYRKNTWEYFPKVSQTLDASGRYIAHGIPTLDIMTRGLSPTAEPEERDRRANEYVEEQTYHAIPKIRQRLGSLGLEQTVSLVMVSECADYAITNYERGSQDGHGGYAPEINKFKIRKTHIDETGARSHEEMALPGLYITKDVIRQVLHGKSGSVDESISKTEMHGKLWLDRENEDMIDLVQELDRVASEVSNKTIYLGEVVPDDFVKDYTTVRQQAAERQVQRQHQSQELRDYVLELEANNVDGWAAQGLVEARVKEMLLKVAYNNPDIAADMFDEKTADGFREVVRLEAMGRHHEAYILQAQVEKDAPAAGFCGAGSCGLESVAEGSSDAVKVRDAGLTGSLLRDRIRGCPGCKKRTIIYGGGGKSCTSCGKTENAKGANATKNNSKAKAARSI